MTSTNTEKSKRKLPILANMHLTNLAVLVFAGGALLLQMHPKVDYGEAEWGLITLVARELLAIASNVSTYYMKGGTDA